MLFGNRELWVFKHHIKLIIDEPNAFSVGYTMSDIHYKWNDGLNSVQLSSDVSLPQFKVLGHRQKTVEASLSTGDSLNQK